jgi:hypothetical protein
MLIDGLTTIIRLKNFKQFVQRINKSDKIKEINTDEYITFVVNSIKNNFIFSIKRFMTKTIPCPDSSFLKVDIWPKRKKKHKPQK